jgi:hypothetical protein
MKSEIVKFQSSELICIKINERVYVAVKPICETIGLHADSAARSIKNDAILGSEHTVQHVQIGTNQSREYLLLPIEHIHGWLFGIDFKKVKEEVQPILLSYKKECYKVLFEHFYGKNKAINTNIEERYRLTEYRKKLNRLINRLWSRHRDVTTQIEHLDYSNAKQLGLAI